MWQRLVGPFAPLEPRTAQAMVLAFAISASAAFALGILFLWHAYLIFTAQVVPLHCCSFIAHLGCQPQLCLFSTVSVVSISRVMVQTAKDAMQARTPPKAYSVSSCMTTQGQGHIRCRRLLQTDVLAVVIIAQPFCCPMTPMGFCRAP